MWHRWTVNEIIGLYSNFFCATVIDALFFSATAKLSILLLLWMLNITDKYVLYIIVYYLNKFELYFDKYIIFYNKIISLYGTFWNADSFDNWGLLWSTFFLVSDHYEDVMLENFLQLLVKCWQTYSDQPYCYNAPHCRNIQKGTSWINSQVNWNWTETRSDARLPSVLFLQSLICCIRLSRHAFRDIWRIQR